MKTTKRHPMQVGLQSSINPSGTNRWPGGGSILALLLMKSRSLARSSRVRLFATTTKHPTRTMKKSLAILALTALATLISLFPAHGDTHIWNGAAITPNWSTPANWVGDNPPSPSEPAPVILIFPAGAARLANVCNIANLAVDEFVFSGTGYSISSAAPDTAITLNNSYLTISCTGSNNTMSVPLILNITNLSFIVGPGKHMHLTGALSGPGNFIKMGKGELHLEGSSDNTFTEPAIVLGGMLRLKKTSSHSAFGGALVIGDTHGPAYPGQAFDSVVMLEGDQQMGFATPVTVNPDGQLNLNGHSLAVGSLTMIGNSQITAGTLTLLGNVSVPHVGNYGAGPDLNCGLSLGGADRTFKIDEEYVHIDGFISSGGGNAGLIKTGFGSLILSSVNTYTGATTINGGGIYLDGSQPNSAIIVHSPGYLTGTGSGGTVNCQGGQFYPHYYYNFQNMTSKDVTLDATSIFGATLRDYQTPASPSFLTATGTVNLGGCKLVALLETNTTFNPSLGIQFTLIQNDGADPVNGTFAGLPEGAKFKFGARQWQITYQGGSGNDVVLTLLSWQLPLSTASLTLDPDNAGKVILTGTGTPDLNTYELHSSTNLTTWTKVNNNVNNDNGTLSSHDFIQYAGPKRFYRFYQP